MKKHVGRLSETFDGVPQMAVTLKFWGIWRFCNYLIPIEIKGSKFAQYECAKIQERRKMPRRNEKTANLQ